MSTTACDMSRRHRIVYVESGLISGKLDVLLPAHPRRIDIWVGSFDLIIYNSPERHSGRVLGSGDMRARVRAGVVHLPRHMIREAFRDDVHAVLDEMHAVILAAADAALKARDEQFPAGDSA